MISRYSRRTFIGLSVPTVLVAVAACQPAPAPAPTAAPAAAGAAKIFIMTDVVMGSKNVPEAQKAAKSCVLNSRFPKNSEIVWRSRVFDSAVGDVMDDKALKGVQIRLANGVNIDMKYGPHPKDPPGEAFWTGSWVVPKDAPTGTLNYSIVAEDTKGRKGDFKPISTAPSLLAVIDETFPDAPAKT